MAENSASARTASPRFQRRVARAGDEEAAGRALAEAVAAGASGAEQRESEAGVTLWVYAPFAASAAVERALVAVLGRDAVEAPDEVEERDWSQAWREGLRAIEVSPRLRIRPSFDASPGRAGQRDLVIDPGQAFGTGGHESTRLALAWLDALRGDLAAGGGMLDVGTGTGVLALAALALGAPRALGLDLDPLAASAALENARANGLAERLGVFIGPIEAIDPSRRFSVVAANMLRRELEPLTGALASRVQPGGWIVIAGLLAEEVAGWSERCAAAGLEVAGARQERDASGVSWAGLLMRARLRPAGG